MTELSQIYGGSFGESSFGYDDDEEERKRHKQQAQYQPQQVPPQQPPQQPPSQPQQLQQQPDNRGVASKDPYVKHTATKETFQNMYRRDELTFWDKLSYKRPEVIKLAIFSLVIVLAIAIDRMGTHYLTKYLSDNIFTNLQEFMIRLSYPVVIFLVIWLVKAA